MKSRARRTSERAGIDRERRENYSSQKKKGIGETAAAAYEGLPCNFN